MPLHHPLSQPFTPGIEAKQVRKQLSERFGIRIAGGQGHQKDTVLRIGHMGYCSATDVLLIISALEVVLTDLGHVFEAGQGTVAAQKALIGGNVHV